MAGVNEVHPCIARAIRLAVSAERARNLARHLPDEAGRFGFEVRAIALSRQAQLALAELGSP